MKPRGKWHGVQMGKIISGDNVESLELPSTVRIWDATTGNSLGVIPIENTTSEYQTQLLALDPSRAHIESIDWNSTGATLVAGISPLGVPLVFDDGTEAEFALMSLIYNWRYYLRNSDLGTYLGSRVATRH
jgi:hypothetical protein